MRRLGEWLGALIKLGQELVERYGGELPGRDIRYSSTRPRRAVKTTSRVRAPSSAPP